MMKNTADKTGRSVGALVNQLASAEAQLEAAMGEGIDAVVDARGNYHLLRLAQESLRQNELKFRALIEHSADGIALLATDGTIRYHSPAAVRVLGYPQTELAGSNVFDLCHPDEAGPARRAFSWLLNRPGRSRKVLLRCRRHDAGYIWLEGSVTNLLQEPAVGAIVLNYRDITERREMEQRLRRSETNLATAQRITHIGSWELELADLQEIDRNPLRWSAELFRIFGYEPLAVEVSNELFFRHVHPDDREKIRTAMAETLRTGRTYSITHRIVRRDGTERLVYQQADLIQDGQGRLLRIIGTAQDITERRATEQRLEEHSTFIADVLNSLTSHVAVLDERGLIIEVNEAWRRFGRENGVPAERQDFVGTNYLEVFQTAARIGNDATARELMALLPELLAGRRDELQLEYPCHSPEQQRWFKLRASRLTGLRKGAVIAHQDITERKLAELALQESEARFRQLAESIDQVFWLRDPDNTRIYYVSPAYEWIWGRPGAGLLANSFDWLEGIHADDRERVRAAAANTSNGGQHDLLYRIVRPDGTERWVHDRGFPVYDDRGNIVRCAGLAEDITEKRAMEDQLLRAQRMESIGTLAGGLAHDINNILAPMLLVAGLLKSKLSDPRDKELLTMIERNAQRGAGIIGQVLTFSRGAGGVRGPVQLRTLVKEMGKIIEETFPRNIALELNLPADLWCAVADATQIHQVIMNLCLNARDAMPNGGRLTLTLANETIAGPGKYPALELPAGLYVVLGVTDTGHGIPAEVRPRLFDPFFTTKPVGKGTGLGLPTVLGIVRGHGGHIDFTSEPGLGTTFRVYLPARPEETGPVRSDSRSPMPLGNGQTVLLVDDEQPMAEVGRTLLEQHNYRVLVANNAESALGLYMQHQLLVRIVLTDVMMPGMSGLELARVLRGLDPALKIIALSGLDADSRRQELTETGVDCFLQKPVEPAVLLRTLDQMLAGAR